MSNPWFRLYSEFAKDAKVQSMDETFQRRYIMFLCLRCNDELTDLDDDELAFALHITIDELTETKELFIKKGFIDSELNILSWDKRQFQSDLSTQRVKAFRERQKGNGKTPPNGGGNGVKRSCNVSETPPDTDTDTDTDTDKRIKTKKTIGSSGDNPSEKGFSDLFEEAWKIYPNREGGNSKKEAWKAWQARIKQGVQESDLIAGLKRYAIYCDKTNKTGTGYVKQAKSFFGPAEHWKESWECSKNNKGNGADKSGTPFYTGGL